jgi:hypothetical protein
MTTVTVALEDDLARRLAIFTSAYRLSSEAVIQLALQKFLTPHVSPVIGDTLAGMFDFGVEDFAERSEEILQQAVKEYESWTMKS